VSVNCKADDCSLDQDKGDYCLYHHGRDVYLRRTYNLPLSDYYAILRFQGGICCLCGKAPADGENLTVDHDHVTLAVRGLLCPYCNQRVIGRHRDWRVLNNAGRYLKNPPAALALGRECIAPKAKRKRRRAR
jgi:hypothetical protein